MPPKISILIAARNEEANILDCLQHIHHLNQPKENLQILLGNDQSTDQTAQIIEQFIADKPEFQLINISQKVGHLKGKANALAQLAQKATGEFLFITDADIQVPKNWIENMLAEFDQNTGIVTGVTGILGERLMDKIQCIDWFFNIYWGYFFSQKQFPVTAMGNNMAIRKSAYEAVGGYENISFSVTEDFMLFKTIVAKGYGFKNLFQENVLAWSKPQKTWNDILSQRKRWLAGAFQLPFLLVLGNLLRFLLIPILLILALFFPKIALSIWLLQIFVHPFFVKKILEKINFKASYWLLLIFECYLQTSGMVYLIFYFMSDTVEWKGRRFEKK